MFYIVSINSKEIYISSFFQNHNALLFGINETLIPCDNRKSQKVFSLLKNKNNKAEMLQELKNSFLNCNKCGLADTRKNIVFGDGNPDARLMFIGEGPGAEEDSQGLPFVGRSGQLLTKMIKAMGYSREEVYIANIVKCRPPENRDPLIEEAQACISYLRSQIQIINPEVIVCLGSVSVNFLLQPCSKTKVGISKLRGVWQEFYGYKVLPTFHPAYLLRNPSKKVEAWRDLQIVMEELGL